MYGYSREAVRVKVQKFDGRTTAELRKFSVDPQITSLEVLHSILVKAFDLKDVYLISYKTNDDVGNEIFVPILSDWDLDAAFLKAHNKSVSQRCEPCIHLQIDTKSFSECGEEWEPSISQQCVTECAKEASQVTASVDIKQQSGFQGMLINQMEKTLSMVTKALNFYDDPTLPPRPPLNDAEFRTFLDPVGKVVNVTKLRDVIYCGGIEPSLRKVVWKHILNVYPDGMTGKERMDYMRNKSAEYYQLRNKWKDCLQKGQVNNDLAYVTTMVRKDVLRTDRHHPFYAGKDDNQNIASLFNILTTYAVNHPQVSYCQGMSDLASPLLVTMTDEAHAYICLCALMSRLYPNFMLDGNAMTLKFAHLTDALQTYDPDFYAYLKLHQADDLLFCYRWLLLEMKREFAFDDALRMLEVLWASLPPKPPDSELALTVQEFDPNLKRDNDETVTISPLLKTPRETAYTKLCAMRRQSSAFNIHYVQTNSINRLKNIHYSLDENTARKAGNSELNLTKEYQSLDDTALRLSIKAKNDGIIDIAQVEDKQVYSDEVFKRNDDKSGLNSDNKDVLRNGNGSESHSTLGTQIRQLRNKISHHNNKFYASLEKLDAYINSIEQNDSDEIPKVKLIKNLNEFLTFANKESCTKIKLENMDRSLSTAESTETKISSHLVKTRSLSDDVGEATTNQASAAKEISNVSDSLSPEDSQEYYPMMTSITRELDLELEQLDKNIFSKSIDSKSDELDERGDNAGTADAANVWENPIHIIEPLEDQPIFDDVAKRIDMDVEEIKNSTDAPLKKMYKHSSDILSSDSSYSESFDTDNEAKEPLLDSINEVSTPRPHKFFSSMSQELENAKKNCEQLLNTKQNPKLQSVTATLNNFQEKYGILKSPNLNQRIPAAGCSQKVLSLVDVARTKWTVHNLPPPEEFGGGNPFLMFLCLTILMQHRDFIMRNRMDYNELAMHFDKMIRKHNVNRVLNQARQLYSAYLKQHPKLNDICT